MENDVHQGMAFLNQGDDKSQRPSFKVHQLESVIMNTSKFGRKMRRAAFAERKDKKPVGDDIAVTNTNFEVQAQTGSSQRTQKSSFYGLNDKQIARNSGNKRTFLHNKKSSHSFLKFDTQFASDNGSKKKLSSQSINDADNMPHFTQIDVIQEKPITKAAKTSLPNIRLPSKSLKSKKQGTPIRSFQSDSKQPLIKRNQSLDNPGKDRFSKVSNEPLRKQSKKTGSIVRPNKVKYSIMDSKKRTKAMDHYKKLSEMMRTPRKRKPLKSKFPQIKLQHIQKPIGYSDQVPDPNELLKFFESQKLQAIVQGNDEHDIYNLDIETVPRKQLYKGRQRQSSQQLLQMEQIRRRIDQELLKYDLKQVYKYQDNLIKNYYQTMNSDDLAQLPLPSTTILTQNPIFQNKHQKSFSTFNQPTYLRKTFLGQVQLSDSHRRLKHKLQRIRKLSPEQFRKLLKSVIIR